MFRRKAPSDDDEDEPSEATILLNSKVTFQKHYIINFLLQWWARGSVVEPGAGSRVRPMGVLGSGLAHANQLFPS